MRPNKDDSLESSILLPDPRQDALSDGVITRWRLFVKILSIQHEVFLQVWRPSSKSHDSSSYQLIGQTLVQPTELREIEAAANPPIQVRTGDVLGLYFPCYNPIGWTSVPCASRDQRYLFRSRMSRNASVGSTYKFERAATDEFTCRHYSFAGILGVYSTLLNFS